MMERILKLLCIGGGLFLMYLGGIVAGTYHTYFYWKMHALSQYLEALDEQSKLKKDPLGTRFYKSRTTAKGVTAYVPQKSFTGLTLYSDATTTASLIDMDGKVVQQWSYPYD